MLIPPHLLEQIERGDVTLAFRRWRRPTVRAGGTLMTAVGVLAIKNVDTIDEDGITANDARRAGYASREALLADLVDRFGGGRLYRIELAFAGPDPRIALRARAIGDADEAAALVRKLQGMDKRSPDGPWTQQTLALIRDRPEVRAANLAREMGSELLRFKQRVRSLKALGLTESLEVGYRLSPRGGDLLRYIESASEG